MLVGWAQLNAEDRFKKRLASEKAKDYIKGIKVSSKAQEINPRCAKVYQHREQPGVNRTTMLKLLSILLKP